MIVLVVKNKSVLQLLTGYKGYIKSCAKPGSDPNRFYQGGFLGSSKARFKEAAKRDGIHHQMDLLQRKIEDRQKYLWDNFQVSADLTA